MDDKNMVLENKIIIQPQKNKQLTKIKEIVKVNNAYVYIEEGLVPKFSSSNIFWKKLNNTPYLDTLKILKSIQNLKNYFSTVGYFNNDITYNITNKKKKHLTLSKIYYQVQLNTPYLINEIVYNIDSNITKNLTETILKKGAVFMYEDIEKKIKELTEHHKNNGYFNIQTTDFVVELDTLKNNFGSLNDKKVNITFLYSPTIDSVDLKLYRVNQIFFNTKYSLTDSNFKVNNTEKNIYNAFRDIQYNSNDMVVNPSILWVKNSIRIGELYNEKTYRKNISDLYGLEMWKGINVKPTILNDTFINNKLYGQINFNYYLQKFPKYNVGTELGLGYNTFIFSDVNNTSLVTPNSWGLNLVTSLTSKNTYKKAVESKLSTRIALEGFFNQGDFSFATYDFGIDFSQKFPWIFPFKVFKLADYQLSTNLNLGIGITQRLNFYNVRNINGSMNWKFENINKNWLIEYRPFLFSFVFLDKFSQFIANQINNPYLNYAFNDGLNAGMSFTITKQIYYSILKKHFSVVQFNIEESGSTWSAPIKKIGQNYTIFKFVKTLLTFNHHLELNKQGFHFRIRGGYGLSYGDDTITSRTLPFYKQFFVGGPNSMRAWNAARLGIGSSTSTDTTSFKDRYGDILLETNFEYRFNLLRFNSFLLESAFFVDIGNIWNRRATENENQNSIFSFNNLYRDLAIAGGTGLRFGFGFLLLRLDAAIKIKDPILGDLTKQYFNSTNLTFNNLTFQLGIGYPF